MSEPIKAGDVVMLKSGSAKMTVIGLAEVRHADTEPSEAYLIWYSDVAAAFRYESIHVELLVHAEAP